MHATPLSKLSLFLFGAPRLERDGSLIAPDTRKAVALLAYLALTGQPHTREILATMFYPDNDEPHAKAAFRRTLSALNKALGDGYLTATHEIIAIQSGASIWVDANEFVRLLDVANKCPHPGLTAEQRKSQETCPICLPSLEQAAALYRGDFMAGFSLRDSPDFDEWQFFKAEELRRSYASALKKLAQSAGSNGDYEQAIRFARQWVTLDPLLEDAHRELMSCYALAGQRNAALRQYHECSRILEKELGVEPLDATQRLYHDIQHNRWTGSSPAAPALMTDPTQPIMETSSNLSWVRFPLVGRSAETETLLRAYQQGAPGGYFFALQGEAGIGKTRLAEEFTAWGRQNGATVLSARCFEGETSLAYAPIIQALTSALEEPSASNKLIGMEDVWRAEAARLLPTLRHDVGEITDKITDGGNQSMFFEGLRQVLLRLTQSNPPGIIFLDDLHWADPASLDFLAYITRRLPGNSLFILAAWRDEDLPTQAHLHQVLAEAQRAGIATGLRLSRLQSAAVADLIRQISTYRGKLPADFSDRLYSESEGLPYFLVEYLDALLAQADGALQVEIPSDSISAEWQLPDRVRDLLRLRIAQVGELAQQLLAAGAVIGRSFDFDTLVAVSGRSEMETLTGLETLLAYRLVEECGGCEPAESLIYDFTHDKLRSLVYEETSLTRRRLLHRRVADALAEHARRSRDPGSAASTIAQHYHLAGRDHQAAEYHRIAGDHAHHLYANRQALDHFYAALEAGHPDQGELYEAIGDLHTLLGEYQSALEKYSEAQYIAVGLKDKARLLQKIGAAHQRRGDYAQAIDFYQQALRLIGETGSIDSLSAALRARLLADWSLSAYQLGEMENALNLAQQALEHANEANAPRALAQAHNLLGVLARHRRQYATAQLHLEESLEMAVRLQDENAQAAALNNLALLLSEEGQTTQAIDYTKQALHLCEHLGDRHHAAALHNNLADLYHLSGQPQEAISHLNQAVAILTEIGGDAEHMQLEMWKLTEW